MPKIILDQAQVMSFVGQREPTGMSQHMGIDMPQFRLLSRPRNDVVHRLAGKGLFACCLKQPDNAAG
jgi:cobalamin biosynthesis Mg chelatase CobN